MKNMIDRWEPDNNLLEKYNRLVKKLKSLGKIAVAFSGGVDSTFLMAAAKEALGENAIAITAVLHSVPEWEVKEAGEYCSSQTIPHFLIRLNELDIPGFKENPPNRCYLCKKSIFTKICDLAREKDCFVVAEGSNLDDEGDYRPGLLALKELGIYSPLREQGFSKQEIRCLSEYFHIPTWNKPSYACLSSRFPYGEQITQEKLDRVEKAEKYLMDHGFVQMRVRNHGTIARIELMPEEMDRFMQKEFRYETDRKFREYGFSYVTLDLRGFRSGSMNEVLDSV